MALRRGSFGLLNLGALCSLGALGAAMLPACGGDNAPQDGPATGQAVTPVDDAGVTGFGSDPLAEGLILDPPNPVIDATGPGTKVTFKATVKGTNSVVPASWSLDIADIGTIGTDGVFSTSGTLGGPTRVIAQSGQLSGTTTLTVKLHLKENTAGVAQGVMDKLRAGGTADPAFKWQYPYDHTVFPRGLLPPVIQLGGGAAESFLLKVSTANLDYEGFFKGSAPSRITLPENLWRTITRSAGAADPVKVEVTKIAGNQVTGPVKESWTIAQGSLKGVVYYNSYDSKLAGNTGAVMRIKPGANAEVFLGGSQNGCTVCHSVSAHGNVLVAAHEPGAGQPGDNGYIGSAFELKNGAPATRARVQGDASYNWGGLYPDGSLLFTNGTVASRAGGWAPNVPGVGTPKPSRLMDPKTGQTVATTGLQGVSIAMMPAFSPDGRKLGFNRFDTTQGKTLSVVDFDLNAKAFSNLTDVVTVSQGFVGWPAFTPDSKWMVFGLNNRDDYSTWQGAKGNLAIVHLGSKTSTPLNAANGRDAQGASYLTGGDDSDLNFEPTILPEPVGGYFWVVFTSRRKYGNTIVDASQDAGPRKKLWVAALDLDRPELPYTKAEDISHPAFYLEGQEQASGNMRGFWSLDACKAPSDSCEPGVDECCNGNFCRQTVRDGKQVFACVPEKGVCAQEFESCTVATDCCDFKKGFQCVAGKCAKPRPN